MTATFRKMSVFMIGLSKTKRPSPSLTYLQPLSSDQRLRNIGNIGHIVTVSTLYWSLENKCHDHYKLYLCLDLHLYERFVWDKWRWIFHFLFIIFYFLFCVSCHKNGRHAVAHVINRYTNFLDYQIPKSLNLWNSMFV